MDRRHAYDVGYGAATEFWPRHPGSLVRKLVEELEVIPSRALDLGCGEGNNAAYLAECGTDVVAVDISALALAHAKVRDNQRITWFRGDVMDLSMPDSAFDCVVAYGLLHCLQGADEGRDLILRCGRWLTSGGYIACVCFNGRHHDRFAEAHPGFSPLLLPHTMILDMFHQFTIVFASDSDLVETHPDRNVPHSHSITRILARKS